MSTVISTRVRLARNLKDYPFPLKLSEQGREKVIELVKKAITESNSAIANDFSFIKISELDPRQSVSLVEKRLVSPEFISETKGRALLLSKDESVSIMLNEEDHIRLQVIKKGLSLEETYDEADRLDTLLDENLSFAFDDSWSVLNRKEIARNMGYNEDYAYADISEVLSYHYPYVELWASNGLITVQIMVENLPITSDNGEQMNTPAEYMDNNAEFIPLTYENSGLSTSDMRRYQEDLCGYPFEAFFFIAEANGMKMPQTMMAAEKDGLILTIYITCIGEDQSGAVLSAFSAIPKE